MDKLPHSLLLQILIRLDNSADVARCRVASKDFNNVFPGVRSINLQRSFTRHNYNKKPRGSVSKPDHPFKMVFLDLISKLETVESVCISLQGESDYGRHDFYLNNHGFAKKWLPKVSESLKSLSLSGQHFYNRLRSDVLQLISAYCRNLVTLELEWAWLSVKYLNPMQMLTSLTLSSTKLKDQLVNEFNKCFPNLQVLYMVRVEGLKHPKIHLLNLKTCMWDVNYDMESLTLITPNLITLGIGCMVPAALHVEAPMLSDFDLGLYDEAYEVTLKTKRFENLKTLGLDSRYTGSFLSQFPITKTVETLTLESQYCRYPREAKDSELTLEKVFTVFPNVSSLWINARVWSGLETCLNPQGWEMLDGRKGLKNIHTYLRLVDPSLTFSYVACVLDQCVGLSEVSLLIHDRVDAIVSKDFMSKCMARWPRLKWRWGIYSEGRNDSWITN